jgi:acid phosphatase (class A)
VANQFVYPEFWNPELRAYVYLNEFLHENPTWQEQLTAAIDKDDLHGRLQREKGAQLRRILELSDERDKRYAEILDQHGAEGAIKYWLRMLEITPGGAPATHQLIRIARRVGEHVVMCLKEQYQQARPSQVCPAIMPLIEVPAHPSFPAGHALQSHLISKCLEAAKRTRNQPQMLFHLSRRVALNRIIAGLHYPLDNEAGVVAAEKCFELLSEGKQFKALLQDAQNESARALESREARRQRERDPRPQP